MEKLIQDKKTKLQHSALSWLSQFGCWWYTVFPKHLWQVSFCVVTGAPNPDPGLASVDARCFQSSETPYAMLQLTRCHNLNFSAQ